MRRLLHITVLVFLYLLLTAKSCDNQEQSDEIRDHARLKLARDSIKSIFESDTLSNVSLRAFEGAAIIKLSDFSDYLTILQDTSNAKPFRDKAQDMIRRLFISEKSLIRFSKPDESGRCEFTIEQFLQEVDFFSMPFIKIIPDSVRVKQELKRSGESIYVGKLSYSYTYDQNQPAKSSKTSIGNETIEFFIKHHEKIFGTDTLLVWDIFLGNME